jgi:DnaJ-class molecular chaperone
MDLRSRKKKPPPEIKRQCHRCNGSGLAPCRICAGSGRVMIKKDINGTPQFDRCSGCLGRKTGRCPHCGGERFR